jgi:Low molecular weight phosphotyrosine protein phosphatase
VPEVLFVCTHNAGRSQMAAALLNQQAAGRVRVASAGSQPASELNPAVVQAMAESGSPGAFPRRGPLGTVLARYQAHGSGKPLGRCGLWCWRPALAGL